MPENVDMLKLEESLKKERVLRYFKNKENLFSMGLLLIGEISGIMQGVPANIIVNLVAPIVLFKLVLNWRDKSYITREMAQVVRESSEYRQCLELYEKYIKELARFIRDLGYENSKEAVLYFDALLNGGILSQNANDVYYNYKYDRVMVTELLGARVVSGKCVCRHYACFAADLFTELGIVSSPLMVKRENIPNPEEKLHNPFTIWTHSLVGIAEDKEKFLYDPTSSVFASKADFEFKDLRYSSYVGKPVGLDSDEYYLIYPGNKMFFNRKYREISYAVGALPMMNVDKQELDYLHKKVENIVIKRLDDIVYFMMSNKGLMKEIANLEYLISPHGDEPIEKWILKKTR